MSVTADVISARMYFTSTSSATPEAVSRLLEEALASPPLSLSTNRDPDAIVGVCAKRWSAVLANWQEQATVRAVVSELPLSVTDPGQGVQHLIGVQAGRLPYMLTTGIQQMIASGVCQLATRTNSMKVQSCPR